MQKQGYELNDRGVIGRQYAYSPTVPLTIVMVSSAQLQANKQRIENNAYKTAEKNYKAKMAKLEQQLNDKTISEKQFRTDLQDLQVKFEKYQNLIDELAEHYAHTDYDVLDEKEAEINVLIENGELEKADSLIHTMFDPVDVLKRNKEALSRIDQAISEAEGFIAQANSDMAAVLKQQEKDAEYLYQLYTIALAQFDNEKASQYIQTRAELDTTNIEWQMAAGNAILYLLTDYSLSLAYYQRGLRQAQLQYNEKDLPFFVIYNNIGLVYRSLAQYDQALEFHNKALEICEEVQYPEGQAKIYNNIGMVYSSIGDYAQALYNYKKALAIGESISLSDPSINALTYNNIGFLYNELEQFSQALEHYHKALEIYKQASISENTDIAIAYNNIGDVLVKQKNYLDAIAYFQKALEILERVLSANHRITAICYNNIGYAYDILDNDDSALEYYQKAQAAMHCILDPFNPTTAIVNHRIGHICIIQGDYEKALGHIINAMLAYDIGDDNENARECQELIMITCKELYSDESAAPADVYNYIGDWYQRLGMYTNALDWYYTALKIIDVILLKSDTRIAETYEKIALAHDCLHDKLKAVEHYHNAIDVYDLGFDREDQIGNCYEKIGLLYQEMGQNIKALKNYEKAISYYGPKASSELKQTIDSLSSSLGL